MKSAPPTFLAALTVLALTTAACQSQSDRDAQHRRESVDKGSVAYKAGEAAHKVARQAEHAASIAARKAEEAGRKAREGWKEESRQHDRRKQDPQN